MRHSKTSRGATSGHFDHRGGEEQRAYSGLQRRRSAMTNCKGRELILIKFVPGASANLLRMPAKEADHEMHLDRHRAACSC
jgi:hypothetical protein